MRLFDLHCDTITELCAKGEHLVNPDRHISLDRVSAFSQYCQAFAIFIPDEHRGQAAIDYFERNYVYYLQEHARYCETIAQATEPEQLDAIFASGRCASILTVEGGCVLAGDPGRVQRMCECGVQMITLTWNGDDELAGGIGGSGLGLTDIGREAVREMERCGIVVDVSHLSDQAFEDLLKVATRPFVASHSNLRSICPHRRNLTEREFGAIVERGGLVGLNFYTEFLRQEDPEHAGFDDLLRHVDRMLELGGQDVLALGSDFDGADMPACLGSIDKLADLYTVLCTHGPGKELADKIFFDNARAFFARKTS